MRAFEVDHGYTNETRQIVRAPTLRDALITLTPGGCHLERDNVEDDRLPGFRFWFIVNDVTGEAVDYLGVRELRKPNPPGRTPMHR